jgi:hypothetical protein
MDNIWTEGGGSNRRMEKAAKYGYSKFVSYSSANIIRRIKSIRIRGTGTIARMEK